MILRKYTLRSLGVKGHDLCNLPSNSSGKKRESYKTNGSKMLLSKSE